jgi:hypothetical protein
MNFPGRLSDRFLLFLFWLFFPVILVLLTILAFHAIFHYYAPNGRELAVPIAKLNNPPTLVTPVEVWTHSTVTQPIVSAENGLAKLRFQTVTFSDRHRPHDVLWKIHEILEDGSKIEKRSGRFSADKAKDWQFITLNFKPIADSICKHYEVSFSAPGTPQLESMGFPVYKTTDTASAQLQTRITMPNKNEQTFPGSLSGHTVF